MYRKISPSVEEFTELPLHYSQFSFDKALQHNLSECSLFFYECYSLSDVVYSILHFLTINKYKFNKCHHCGQYFATPSNKQIYCPRNSSYRNFEHLSCEQAVRNIFQKIRRKQRKIYRNLSENYHLDNLNNFQRIFEDTFSICKKKPSYINIDKCFDILSSDKWYTKPSIRNRGKKLKTGRN